MTAPAEVLAVFARAPELGRVKTRLCPPLTADEAVALHRALVEDTLDHLGKLERPGLSRLLLLSRPLLQATDLDIPRGWTLGIQAPGDLGVKLASFFQGAFRREAHRVVVVGSDSPTLPLDVVCDAFDELSRVDVALGPSADGGYYLIGASTFLPDLFQGISWGTDVVLQQTKHAIERIGHKYKLLLPWYDVDRPRDIERLREEIGYLLRSHPDLVPRRAAAALPDLDESEFSLGPEFD